MKRKEKQEKVKKIISIVFIILSGVILSLYIYINTKFKEVSVEQILYTILYSKGTSFNAIGEGLLYVIFLTFVFCSIFLFPFYVGFFFKVFLKIRWKNKKWKISLLPFKGTGLLIYSCILFFIFCVYSFHSIGLFEYLYYQFDNSILFEDFYVNPKNVKMAVGDKKNVIYIFGESLEVTNLSVSSGGAMVDSYMPHLEELANKYINFSNNDEIGGAIQFDGLGWTVAGMVAQTAGVPLKIKIDGNSYQKYSSFLPGVYSLGEILKKNGYNNYIMMGSDSSFGGRNEYFTQHGDYEIFDYNWAVKNKKIDDDYYVWWGYEDNKLFEFAKEKLLEISGNGEPFNFSLLTADTHFPNGYLDSSCSDVFGSSNPYANSIYCSDGMIYDFVKWIQKQNFYKDTVVVIVGDHLSMQTDLYDIINSSYQRTVYNVFINSNLNTDNNKNRLFSTMDIYPTVLASMGFEIEGDKLGLGTNLFSDKKTIVEKFGVDYLKKEIKKKSKFYDDYLLGDSYKEMLKDVNKEK